MEKKKEMLQKSMDGVHSVSGTSDMQLHCDAFSLLAHDRGVQPMQDWDVEESRLGLVRTRVDGIDSRS